MMSDLVKIVSLLTLAVHSTHGGGCTFPAGWTGSWFQSGAPGLIAVNRTHIHSKGECAETDSNDKFLLYDRSEDCYRCMVIHEKHKYVLQYKETFCSSKDSLSSLCESISGDAPLYSMFLKEPRPEPQECPFRPPPFTFVYNRGTGDCAYPPSRAEACTDDSRLLLRYIACPDVPATESNLEELVCLATWKEGSTRYLVGQISQVQRRNSIASDEDTYRCFIYKGQRTGATTTYHVAQSGDATCNGLSSPTDGSRTMTLTNSDDEHNRCHFPSWIVEHHKWYSLDRTQQYHFTTKNATLKIMNADGTVEEKRLVCHSILEQRDKRHIKLVAHVTRGCESGHACVEFERRSPHVLEVTGSSVLWDSAQDACAAAAAQREDPLTLIAASPVPTRCPIQGRFSAVSDATDGPRAIDHSHLDEGCAGEGGGASAGCGAAQDTIELRVGCDTEVYKCYGGWRSGARGYFVAAPRPRADPALCFIYEQHANNGSLGAARPVLALSAARRTCDRALLPGRTGHLAYNLTINGTCEQSSQYNSPASSAPPSVIPLVMVVVTVMNYIVR